MPQHENVSDIPVSSRRLDSIAWLIQGDDVCGAVCFDGNNLLLASNKRSPSRLIELTTNYLQTLVEQAEALSEIIARDPNDIDGITGVSDTIDDEIRNLRAELSHQELYQEYRAFSDAVDDSIEKLADSIIAHHIAPGGEADIGNELVTAIKNGKIEFVPGKMASNGGIKYNGEEFKPIHAEMKIIDKLMEDRKITNGGGESFYIGISKRCCVNCEVVIESVNEIMGREGQEVIKVRDEGHEKAFPSGIPTFLEKDDDASRAIAERVCEKMGHETLEEAYSQSWKSRYKQAHEPSPPPSLTSGLEFNWYTTLNHVLEEKRRNLEVRQQEISELAPSIQLESAVPSRDEIASTSSAMLPAPSEKRSFEDTLTADTPTASSRENPDSPSKKAKSEIYLPPELKSAMVSCVADLVAGGVRDIGDATSSRASATPGSPNQQEMGRR